MFKETAKHRTTATCIKMTKHLINPGGNNCLPHAGTTRQYFVYVGQTGELNVIVKFNVQ